MSITPAPLLRLTGLSADENDTLDKLTDLIARYVGKNMTANAYYEAKHLLTSPGFTIPQEVANRLAPVTGVPGTVVDVLDERLDFLGWDDSDPAADLGLDQVFDDNELDSEGSMAHLDALIYGTAFARVGVADEDASPLVTIHSPLTTTGIRDAATRRLSAAWTSLQVDDDETVRGVLDLPHVSITVELKEGRWTVIERDEHALGRVPVVQFVNRPRASRRGGRSEITPGIRSKTEDMMRAALGMNVNTMFYSIPQLMILGRGPDAFKDRDGNPVPGWKVLAGHAMGIKKDADGDVPDIKQLEVASPAPFIEQLREFRLQVASEAGMPADYFGIQAANPSSADAIQRSEARLVERARRRQVTFGRSWREVARLALLVRDGDLPEDFDRRIEPEWSEPKTETPAATADALAKLIGANVLAPDSEIVRKRLGLTPSERRVLQQEQRRSAGRSVLDSLRERAQGEALPPPNVETSDDERG